MNRTPSIVETYIDEVKEMYACDVPISRIAKDCGINESTLRGYINRHPDIFEPLKTPKRKRPRPISEEQSKEMYKLWLDGMTIYEIAKKFDRNYYTVYSHVRKESGYAKY